MITAITNQSNASVLSAPTVSSADSTGFEQQLLSMIQGSIENLGLNPNQFQVSAQPAGGQSSAASRQILVTYTPPTTDNTPSTSDDASAASSSTTAAQYEASIAQAGYNPAQYADPATAQSLADRLGGTVTSTDSQGPIGPPDEAMISFGGDKQLNAGLVAQEFATAQKQGIPDSVVMKQIQDELAELG